MHPWLGRALRIAGRRRTWAGGLVTRSSALEPGLPDGGFW
jgi:hypothetical protein